MNNIFSNLIKYILKNYPHKSELSASRVTKMLYLADWKSAINSNHQLTDAVWHFHHYGPYVDDFIDIAKEDSGIKVVNTHTIFGGKKQQLALKDSSVEIIDITNEQKEILDFVISTTKDKSYEDFIRLIYSTYPVVSSNRYSDLDLVNKAKEYTRI